MIGKTLGFYFFRRFVSTTILFILGVFALAYIVDFTEFTNRTGSLPKFDVKIAMAVSAMRVPLIMQIAVPFIVLFSAMATLMNLNRKYELVVARSVGVSAWQFLLPACAGALFIGALAVFALNPLAAAGFAKAEEIEGEWRATKSSLAGGGKVPWLSQSTVEGDAIIGATRVTNAGARLYDVTFLLFDENNAIAQRYDAARADLLDGKWRMTDVVVTKAGNRPEAVKSVDLMSNLRKEVVEETLAPPEMIPIYSLPQKIAAARSFGVSANPFAMQFHSLTALPALLVAMTLIAATVSLRFVRFGQSIRMILGGILAGFVLYVVSVLVKSFGSAGIIPPPLAAWMPVIAAGLFGTGFLLHREDG
ncbi:MAG TPA: LPS export ABC transporter permease LptG [Rhizobiaceae bacterium]|nr:LPS export ABC transporter permease LptG [Rhizobiaceae bacterium]